MFFSPFGDTAFEMYLSIIIKPAGYSEPKYFSEKAKTFLIFLGIARKVIVLQR